MSYPLIGASIILAFFIMIVYYWFQNLANVKFDDKDSYFHWIMRTLPSIIYSIIVIPLNMIYKYVAILLTDWENHRTQTAYESNLTTKLFVVKISLIIFKFQNNKLFVFKFYFANNFMTLFYEAFFDRNLDNLLNVNLIKLN